MHRLPDRPAFSIVGGQSFKYLRGAGFAGLWLEEGFVVISDLLAHRLRLNEQTGEPIVRNAVLFIKGIHGDRQTFEPLPVALVNHFLSGNVLLKMQHLAPDDPRNYVGHSVIIAQLFMLIPGGGFSCLGGPFTGAIGGSHLISQ